MKSVFLGPLDLGLNQVFKEEMKKVGYVVTTCSFVEHRNFGWVNDIELRINKVSLPTAILRVFGNFFKSLNYDIYHFKFGQSLLPWNIDLPLLKLLGKKIIMNFHGQDIRQWDRFQRDPWNKVLFDKLGFSVFKEIKKRLRFNWLKLWVDQFAVSTPDLLEFSPGAKYMPEMAPLSRIGGSSLPSTVNRQPKNAVVGSRSAVVILHAPSHRGIKGTEFVKKAISELKKEGYPVELLLAENVPAAKIGEYYAKADVVVDQLLIGAYGVVSVEAMLAGKPVVCYIRNDLRRFYPRELPILSANPASLKTVLKGIIQGKAKREKLGRASLEYIKKHHAPEILAKKWAKLYRAL